MRQILSALEYTLNSVSLPFSHFASKTIKRNIQDETVSLDEIIYLQDHLDAIFILNDAELAQWAGLNEQGFQKYDNYYDYCLAEEKGEFENE